MAKMVKDMVRERYSIFMTSLNCYDCLSIHYLVTRCKNCRNFANFLLQMSLHLGEVLIPFLKIRLYEWNDNNLMITLYLT